jgi:Histone methylation protein DOT1
VYDHVTAAFPITLGKVTSKKEREEAGKKDNNLIYGEITFDTFGIVIEKIRRIYGKPDVGSSGPDGVLQHRGGIFYDLGSGTGKPVVAAALLFNFDLCCGIEVLEGLYSVSLDLMQSYNTRGKSSALLAGRDYETHCQCVQGSFLNMKIKDWRDGDIVFMNSTCFDDKLMEKIAKRASECMNAHICLHGARYAPLSLRRL